MRKSMIFLTTVVAAIVLLVAFQSLEAQQEPLERFQAWSDCELFKGLVIRNFDPESVPFDELYIIVGRGSGFLDGATAISESGPGDTDYNGGRWHLI